MCERRKQTTKKREREKERERKRKKEHTHSTENLIRFTGHKHVDAVVLATQLGKEGVFKLGQSDVLVAGNDHGGGLVASGVHLDLMLEGVVVEIV